MDKELKNKDLEQVSGGNNPFSGDPLLLGRENKSLPKMLELYCKDCGYVIMKSRRIPILEGMTCSKCGSDKLETRDAT